jgi:hypothetical protein
MMALMRCSGVDSPGFALLTFDSDVHMRLGTRQPDQLLEKTKLIVWVKSQRDGC